ncbi:MAG: alpha/beta fold hydrolase [Candidatus Rokubacteria bacterium]|nr:alpha/beta fold hydrolase [Candidatus Rokubacteria bacterium]
MGQERFADVVERFANGFGAVVSNASPETVKQWQEEIDKNVRRLKNLHAMLTSPVEPKTGQTPREEIYKKNKSRLYRYASSRKYRTPLLFVPNLGISRPYIFDLLPNGSFIEHMTREGFDFYLLDWGVFGPEDNGLTVEECVTKILPRMARKALESSGASELTVLGYCMGAPMSACFVASHPEIPVKNYIDMAGPIDFDQVGLFGLWLSKEHFNVDRFVDTLGSVPADMVKAGFKLIKPTMDLSTNLNLWWNLWNDTYVEGFQALNKWANEYVAFPGEFFRQWVRDFYQGNKLYRGELLMGGRPVRLADITCPVFAVGAKEDYIAPPACVRALVGAVGSREKEYVELPGGHISLIAGRGAALHCWPKVSGWLGPRSAQAWARLVSQQAPSTPTPDPWGFWRPVLDQGLQTWARLFSQTPATPDLLGQWKQFLDQWIEGWSKVLGQTMGTEQFAKMMGQSLDSFLVSQAPVKKLVDQQVEQALQAFNLPSRSQVTAVAKQLVELEERIERLEDGINAVLKRLSDKEPK